MLIGLEQEFFLVAGEEPQVITGCWRLLPADSCGWLVEARGKPFDSVVDAVYSLQASAHTIRSNLTKINAKRVAAKQPVGTLLTEPVLVIPKLVRQAAARVFTKGTVKYRNLHGFEFHRNRLLEATAGLHISFTRSQQYTDKDNNTHRYNINFDWPHIFLTLDKAFREEIRAAKRNPGFYEVKSDGRVEYRSLPNNVNLDKVIDVVQSCLRG